LPQTPYRPTPNMGLRQERVGGGRTNMAGVPPIPAFPVGDGSRPGSAGGSRPSSAASRGCRLPPSDGGSSGPRSRPTSAPASRVSSTASSGRPPRPWHDDAEQGGGNGQRFARRERALGHVPRESDRERRDDLYAGSPAAASANRDSGCRTSSRPGTASSRASRTSSAGREGLPPNAGRPSSAPVLRKREESRPGKPTRC
jgi:hypothetical protein